MDDFNALEKTDVQLDNFFDNLRKICDIEKQKEEKYMAFFNKNKDSHDIKPVTSKINKYNYEKKKIIDRVNDRLLARDIKPKNEYDGDFDTLVEELNNNIYKKTWNRLHPELKINRIYTYIKILKNKYKFTDEHETYLIQQLSDAVRKRLITKKTHIDYDQENGNIISIENLEYCEQDNTFNFTTD